MAPGSQTPATSWWRIPAFLIASFSSNQNNTSVSPVWNRQISCTPQSLAASCPLSIQESSSGIIHGSGHLQAAAKGIQQGVWLFHLPVLCPSHRGLSWITKPLASSSLISFNNYLQSTPSVPDAISSTYQYKLFHCSQQPSSHKIGATSVSILHVRNQPQRGCVTCSRLHKE